jgi:hypothetical protein
VQTLCSLHPNDLARYVLPENTLTHRFQLFCELEPLRVFYKVLVG